jgi:endonuclease YncB( thermonuclease family)
MKYLLTLFVAITLAANPYRWPIVRVIDGDTVEVSARWLPIELGKNISIRLHGIDTPESGGRAKCQSESQLAAQAKQFVQQQIAGSKRHAIIIRSWDKYGGRILGDVMLDGVSLSQLLINRGYAKPYSGDKKTTWCN